MEPQTARQKYLLRWNALKTERSSWDTSWRELAEYIQPRRARFFASDRNQGGKKNQNIINNTGGWAARTLASGMMAGLTSPARPWFRLTTPDPELAEFGAVKEWLHVVEARIRLAFERSNFYNGLHSSYTDLAVHGTSALYVREHSTSVLRAFTFPIGSFCLANSADGKADTIYRGVSYTIAQLVEEFGLENCSKSVQEAHTRGRLDDWRQVLQVVEPNRELKHGRAGPEGMRFSSAWLEVEGDEATGLLRLGGFEEFPVMAPRWMAHGEDVYGDSPGMDVIGDVKGLQLLEKRKAQLVDKLTNPPMRGPASMMGQHMSLLPGDVTLVPGADAGAFAPALVVNPAAVQVTELSIREHENRIKTGYYADLWMALTSSDGPQMTAREVAERHDEKMLQLGPVLERLQDELLDPSVDRAFGILYRRGELPPPPRELQGQEMKVEYISILAQAQKLLGTSSIERLASFVGNLAGVKPEVLDKVDFDQAVDEYGAALGVPPALVRGDDQVAAIRQQRAQQQQSMMQAEQAAQLAQTTKTLSETDVNSDSALSRLVGNLGGVAAASAGRRG